MCHKNRAEEIEGLCNREKFMKANSWTVCGNAPCNRESKIEIKQVSNICPVEIFFPAHKWVSFFKLEQATLIKPLRNFRSSRSIPVPLPTTCLQCFKRKDNSSSLFPILYFPPTKLCIQGKISHAAFSFSFSLLHLPFQYPFIVIIFGNTLCI